MNTITRVATDLGPFKLALVLLFTSGAFARPSRKMRPRAYFLAAAVNDALVTVAPDDFDVCVDESARGLSVVVEFCYPEQADDVRRAFDTAVAALLAKEGV